MENKNYKTVTYNEKKNTYSGMLIGKSRKPNSYRDILKSKEAG